MAEESRMTPPPPPPPSRSSKPVPPPPPGRGATPPAPPAPAGGPAMPPMPGGKSAPAPIPFPPGGAPVGMPPGMPGMPAPGARNADPRLQELERRLQEQEESRKKLEDKTRDLETRLKDEHEKVILQSLKAKEEESLYVREKQHDSEKHLKKRREKYEQELQESRGKAEGQLKDMERRIAEERETWMTALKNQLKEREVVEREVEDNLTRRLRDMEQRTMEDKNQWTLSIKQKTEELNQQHRHFELELEKWKEVLEDRDEAINRLKEEADEDRHKGDLQHQAEYRALQAQFETQMRETGSWKAQVAMVQAQNQQLELQQQQDRTRTEGQLRGREDELKREYSLRDHERTQYWEGVVNQLRGEKENLRTALARAEDEAARLRTDMEKARRLAREEALRDLPEVFEERMAKERKTLAEEHARAVQALQLQLVKSGEAMKALTAKFEIEQRRWEQQKTILVQSQDELQVEKAGLSEELQKLKADMEKQTKELFHHIAESQMKESATREEMGKQKQEWHERQDLLRLEKEKLDAAVAASLQEAYAKEEQTKRFETEIEALKSRIAEWTRLGEEARAREELMKGSQSQLTTAFHNVQGELVKLQNERTRRDVEWTEKEATWQKAKAEWEKTKAELEKTQSAPILLSADAQKAMGAIRQHMQELRTLLAGLRP